MVMATRTVNNNVPAGYDPSKFPAFAVTVDVVILTMVDGAAPRVARPSRSGSVRGHVGDPGRLQASTETLDEAAPREFAEETGVHAASLLAQFGAYGDPGRDPRMNVVTVGYVAVIRDVGTIVAGTDAAEASLDTRVAACTRGPVELAFDHDRIIRDAVARVRTELEVTGLATAFVGPTFTLAELRPVYEAVWGVQLDSANFRRSVVAENGWVIPTGRRSTFGRRGRQAGRVVQGRQGMEAGRADSTPATNSERQMIMRELSTTRTDRPRFSRSPMFRSRCPDPTRSWSRCMPRA